MPEPLTAPQSKLERHFLQMGGILASAVDSSVEIRIDVEWTSSRVVSGLSGAGCEFISRNRGLRVAVAPLIQLPQDLWAWLGYREEWDEELPRKRNRKFSFRSVGLTIHFGLMYEEFKPQMFRAEWAGWAKWRGVDYSFQTAGAGHPHWQIDALDSLPENDLAEQVGILRDLLTVEPEIELHEFSPQLRNADVRDAVSGQKFSKMHFASAAAWWKPMPHDEHAHGPANLTDVESWVQHAVDYVKLELKRL